MSNRHRDELAELLGSQTRAWLLEFLHAHPGESFGFREAARRAGGLDYRTTRAEMLRFHRLGWVREDSTVQPRRFTLDPRHPAHPDLRALVLKVGRSGVVRVLHEELRHVPWIHAAVAYGSVVKGDMTPASDVDVLIVGDGTHEDFLSTAERVEGRLGRRLDFLLRTPEEFDAARQDPESFIAGLLESPHAVVKGAEWLERR